jgi:tRNA threonylcarbamoyladenosine biosynthesis protein TsaE
MTPTGVRTLTTHSPEETEILGRKIGAVLRAGDVVFLIGDLGSGKTRLTKGIAAGMGVDEGQTITSPTFTLVHRHPGRVPLIHVDLYRVEHAAELDEVGIDELLDGDGACVVEWPDRFAAELGPARLTARLAAGDAETDRRIAIESTDANLLDRLA